MGYDYMGMSFQEDVAAQGVSRRHLRLLAPHGVSDPGGAVRELVAAVQRAAADPDRRLRRVLRLFVREMVNNVYAQIGSSC
jgi:hypothetical protein